MEVRYATPETWSFLLSLPESTLSKYVRVADMLEEHGHEIGMPYSKPIGHGMFELRVRGIQEVRAIYVYADDAAIVLHAFIKKSDKIPRHDLVLADRRKRDLERK